MKYWILSTLVLGPLNGIGAEVVDSSQTTDPTVFQDRERLFERAEQSVQQSRELREQIAGEQVAPKRNIASDEDEGKDDQWQREIDQIISDEAKSE